MGDQHLVNYITMTGNTLAIQYLPMPTQPSFQCTMSGPHAMPGSADASGMLEVDAFLAEAALLTSAVNDGDWQRLFYKSAHEGLQMYGVTLVCLQRDGFVFSAEDALSHLTNFPALLQIVARQSKSSPWAYTAADVLPRGANIRDPCLSL